MLHTFGSEKFNASATLSRQEAVLLNFQVNIFGGYLFVRRLDLAEDRIHNRNINLAYPKSNIVLQQLK